MRFHLTFLACVVAFTLSLAGAASAEMTRAQAHTDVQKSIVHLTVKATARKGTLAGQKDAIESQATGFLVSGDGFILTTEHFFDPLFKSKAVNLSITASIGDAAATKLPVQFVSELRQLDLMLLKANIPFGYPTPIVPLHIGSTAGLDLASPPEFLTSGFHSNNYRRKHGSLNGAKSEDVPYAWTIDIKTSSGQSGSPVYVIENDRPTVVGVIKGVLKTDDELTHMIPIEYSMPLIGHFKLQKLIDKVDRLARLVGKIPGDKKPLHDRLNGVENHLREVGAQFEWSATSRKDDALVVKYKKIIGDGPQIDSILLSVTPIIKLKGGPNGPGNDTIPEIGLNDDGDDQFARFSLSDDKRIGKFVVPGVGAKLRALLAVIGSKAVGGAEPFSALKLSIVPVVGAELLPPESMRMVPTYLWKSGAS